ncbi:Novel plant SNARE [Seminavis robusta]|uniref:Novel plant SNARE n=1 Tax=Seminavis robusta TaxID=568900 RepID=A0A9N8HG16_9STRA|nr:Novel plant SNARE [Seminavis robusta]|eukprot:Sro552_g165060.1 Novel plant SNARE (260) ;mRNA; r:22183-23362
MTDIQYWDDTLSEEIDKIQELIDMVQSMGDGSPEKTGIFDKIEKHLRAAQGTKRSFKMEIRLVADVNARKKFETRLQVLDQKLNTLQADCKALRQEHERGELFDGQGGPGEVNEDDAVKAGDNMLGEAVNLQNKTQDSLSNTKQLIAASKEVGMATLEELERQRDVLNNIEKEIDRVDDNLARAEALLKQFGTRMASDKFIQCCGVLNCLLLGGVIVFSVVKGGGIPGVGDSSPADPLAAGATTEAPVRMIRSLRMKRD